MSLYRPTSKVCAALITMDFRMFAEEKRKEVTRVRMAPKALKKICNRQILRTSFLEDLADELLEYGLVLNQTPTSFGLVAAEAVDAWPNMAATRMKPWIKRMKIGTFDEEEIFNWLAEKGYYNEEPDETDGE